MNVSTIAAWTAITTRVAADSGQVAALVDAFLQNDVARELEAQMLNGSGSGEELLGLLQDSGVQTAGPPVAPGSDFDAIRQAITKVMIGGRTVPNGVVLHPNNAESIDLLKVNDEPNRFVGNPFAFAQPPLWGLARVVSEAITEGTALVGDFSKAILFERESITVRYGTVGNDFLRNIVRVLAEGRWGFGVVRPKAFVKVTLA